MLNRQHFKKNVWYLYVVCIIITWYRQKLVNLLFYPRMVQKLGTRSSELQWVNRRASVQAISLLLYNSCVWLLQKYWTSSFLLWQFQKVLKEHYSWYSQDNNHKKNTIQKLWCLILNSFKMCGIKKWQMWKRCNICFIFLFLKVSYYSHFQIFIFHPRHQWISLGWKIIYKLSSLLFT